MNIKILQAGPYRGHLRVVFENPNWYSTPEGKRALRILLLHTKSRSHGSDHDSGALLLHGKADVGALNTTAKCRAEMDRLMNVPIQLTFPRHVVRATNDQAPLTTPEEVRRVRDAGGLIQVVVMVRSNLAFLSDDYEAVERMARAGFAISEQDPCTAYATVYMAGHLAQVSPWKIVRELPGKLERAIK